MTNRTFVYHCRSCGPVPVVIKETFVPYGIFCPNWETQHPNFQENAQRDVKDPIFCPTHGIQEKTIVDEALHRKGCSECLRETRS